MYNRFFFTLPTLHIAEVSYRSHSAKKTRTKSKKDSRARPISHACNAPYVSRFSLYWIKALTVSSIMREEWVQWRTNPTMVTLRIAQTAYIFPCVFFPYMFIAHYAPWWVRFVRACFAYRIITFTSRNWCIYLSRFYSSIYVICWSS